MNNSVLSNRIKRSGKWDLAYDGTGANNCFSGNVFTGESGPPDIETLYDCANRPFPGVPYGPVQSDVVSAIALGYTREQKEPPEPKRPKCQRGRRGCHRH